jgi:hypothetical protein
MFKPNPLPHHEATHRSLKTSVVDAFVFLRPTEGRRALPAMPEMAVQQTRPAEVR